ncbi:hypothetical protein NQZ79_g3500 [Umbelopsis isabellina]|nr:hypothetical protein NQZ79_g3500 [Umbelopsis isabellina]
MPATDSKGKAMAETKAKPTNVISAPIAKKRKLSPAEALIKSMTAKKAIAAQKQRPAGSHVTFGDNDEVIEKKAKIEVTDGKKKKPTKKKSKASKKAAATATTTSTSSIFHSDSTGSILPVHSSVEYLRAWKSDRSSWKFQKVRQTWLLSNLYDEIKIGDEDFAILLEYLQELKGKARQTTIEEATQINQQYPDNESESESDSQAQVGGAVDDDDEFDAEKMMARAQKQAQSAKSQEQKQERQIEKKKAQRAMELLRTLS